MALEDRQLPTRLLRLGRPMVEQAGVSKRLNVRFEDVADDGSFKEAKRAA